MSVDRTYLLRVLVNGRSINRIIIDPHYELKHSNAINDNLILELVKTLNGRTFWPEKITSPGWEIYVHDPLYWDSKPYRLIWCLHPDEPTLGVINAFRRKNKKWQNS